MYYLRLIRVFVRQALQNVLAYRFNFFMSLFDVLLSLGIGIVGLQVLFSQVPTIQCWDFASSLVLLGVYETLGALRRLFINPSLDALAGLDGDIWNGKFDFLLLRPIHTQFLASFRHWHVFAIVDLSIALVTVGVGVGLLRTSLTVFSLLAFLLAVIAGVVVLYALTLIFVSLVFWSPFLYTWVFNSLFQLARYPVAYYPTWLRLMLTWVIPLGVMTTIPAQALRGEVPLWLLGVSCAFALALLVGSSRFFYWGLRRYASASS